MFVFRSEWFVAVSKRLVIGRKRLVFMSVIRKLVYKELKTELLSNKAVKIVKIDSQSSTLGETKEKTEVFSDPPVNILRNCTCWHSSFQVDRII